MEQKINRTEYLKTDWIPAREAVDENRTGSQNAEGSVLFHCYTTGWLVCADGPEKGRDYRLKFGFNRIGRRHDLEVCIFEDQAISRDVHCSLVYEEKGNTFYLVPGEGTATYMLVQEELLDSSGKISRGTREEILTEPAILHAGDRFRIGGTMLEFIPYCREGVAWTV